MTRAERLENLRKMAAKYKAAGNEVAYQRCLDQIRRVEVGDE